MVTTPDTVALQKGAVKPAQPEQTASNKATTLIESLIQTPTLPSGTTISPQLQQVGTNELITTPGISGQVTAAAPTVTAAPTIAGAAPTAAQVTTATTMPTYGQYTGTQVAGAIPTMAGAAGTVTAPAVAQAGTITDPATPACV